MAKVKGKRSIPHTYVIIFSIVIICAILTWFIPGGKYSELTVVVDGVEQTTLEYQRIESHPQTWQVFSSLLTGFAKQAKIVAFILIIGGVFWIINYTKAIDAVILSFIRRTKRLESYRLLRKLGVNNIIMILIMLMFSLFGAIFGMSEEAIVFIAIIIPLAISMGYDSIVGVGLVYLSSHMGFAGAILNPFTIGIAQGIAEIPLFSGIEYRIFCWFVITTITIVIVLYYAQKIKKNPTRSIVYEDDAYWREKVTTDIQTITYTRPKSAIISYILTLVVLALFSISYPSTVLTIGNSSFNVPFLVPILSLTFALVGYLALRKSMHFFVLTLFAYTVLYLIVGVMGYQWYLTELSAIFLGLGVLSGIAAGCRPSNIAKLFVEGSKDILSAAMVVGLAGGIIVILEDGRIIDTILHSLAQAMDEAGKLASVSVMYAIQTLINFAIPSGSAKAALTMPIMAPFADLIGIPRQAAVMAYQMGDGFSSMIAPTSGVLIAVLGIARIPYAKWLRWVWPVLILFIILGFLLLIPTVTMTLNGF